MKICPKCHIQAGVISDICPVCQNGLEGEGEYSLWPSSTNLKKKSLFYKIQLLVILVGVVICLGLDLLIDLHGKLHWSLIVALWGISFELVLRRIIKRSFIVSKVIGNTIITTVVLLLLTAWYAGFWNLAVYILVPSIVLAALTFNFVMALIDKSDNAMVYLLCSILGGSIPVIGLIIKDGKAPILWNICIMASVVSIIGIAVFKSGKMLQEIRKRTNI